jgi:lipoprotein-anchoring transpeptidase ErfK/SrfK
MLLLALFLALQPPLSGGGTGVSAGAPQASDRAGHADRCDDPLAYQVLLDRRGFSPGEIDGQDGPNLRRAITGYQQSIGMKTTGQMDCATWQSLLGGNQPDDVLVGYRLTPADLEGPFLEQPLPDDLTKQSNLPALSYVSPREAIAERFHMSPRLLTSLNKSIPLEAGRTIRVPSVTPFDPSQKPSPDSTAGEISIEVSRSHSTLRATRADGSVAMFAPVSSGSEHDPLPIGTWKVNGTSWMPPFHYNPDLFWDAEPGHSRSTIKPGPNNPVGVVWIDISVPHYGMHGTPAPNLVGHTQSHGCVRLTNWDAAHLASLVKPGTRVVFTE